MDKRTSGSLLFANSKTSIAAKKLKAGFTAKMLLLATLLVSINACDFIVDDGKPNIPSNNPGANANLAPAPLNPTQNLYRMDQAIREQQNCVKDSSACDPVIPLSHIQYIYDDTTAGAWGTGGLLNRTVEREPDSLSTVVVSYRLYIYDATNNLKLDKVAVADDGSSNFHTLHDYTYDDEDDPSDMSADVGTNPPETDGYNANLTLTAPKLRKEYICTIDTANPAPSATITTAFPDSCDRYTADETITYIYYANGLLFRKEFDTDNDGDIDHQKIYSYNNLGELTRVDTDNYYNGILDEVYEYDRDTFAGEAGATTLRAFIDWNRLKNEGVDRTVSYELDVNNNPVRECYYGGELNKTVSNYNAARDGITGVCLDTTTQYLQWRFVWVTANCWAGGLENIDPETRAIGYLCGP